MCLLVFIFGLGFGAKASAATYYISQSTTNGYLIGNDANGCTNQTTDACLTIARGISVSVHGDTVMVNDGTYNQGASSLAVNKNISLLPVTPLGVTVTSDNTTQTVNISPADDANNLTVGAIIINAQSTAAAAVNINNRSRDITVLFNGTRTVSPTQRHYQDQYIRGTTKYVDISMTGNLVEHGIWTPTNVAQTAAKKFIIDGLAMDLTGTRVGGPMVVAELRRYSAGVPQDVYAYVSGITGTVTASGLGADSSITVLEIDGISNGLDEEEVSSPVIIEDCNFSLIAREATGNSSYGILVQSPNSNAPAHNPVVRNNIINFYSIKGYGILTGNTLATTYVNDPAIYGNTVTGEYYPVNSPHGIAIGGNSGGLIYKNRVNDVFAGILMGINQGGHAYYNILHGCYGTVLYSKGSGNSVQNKFSNNTVILSDDAGVSREGALAVEVQSGINNSNTLFVNNLIFAVDTLSEFVKTGTNQIATFSHNLYYSQLEIPTGAWTYIGTGYDTAQDWINAIGTSDVYFDPVLENTDDDFTLQNTSSAINAGTDVGLTIDYAGNPVPSGPNPDMGAYEFQDSTAPTTSNNITAGTYNSVQSITLTCVDGSGVGCDKTYYTLDGNDPTTSSSQYSTPISTPDNATTVFKYFSRDKNLNAETIKSRTYTIDTTAPNTTINSNPNSLISTNSATFTFSASETSTYQCKMDSGSYASCTSPKNYTSLAEGSHTFYVKATDSATNEDPTPASYTFTVDTEAPTISNPSPNNTILSAATTSTNLTLTTSETTTCKYSTTSGTDYASMTAFDSTNNITHSTAIAGLNSGATYDYYILCKDAINESAEAHLTFSIAPEENKISLNSIKIKIERETNKFKDKIYSWKNKFKLKGDDGNLAGGQVKIYKNGKKIETVDVGSDGIWSQILKLKDNFSGWIKIRQYDQYGTLLGTKKVKVKIDTEKPEFTNSWLPWRATREITKINWNVKDNDKIDKYKIYIGGRIYTTKFNTWQIPREVSTGRQYIKIKAYDKAGNTASKESYIWIR